MSDRKITISIDDDEDLVAARSAAEHQGVSYQEVTGEPSGDLEELVEPVTAVLIGAGVVAGVKMVMDWWERRKGGLVIDLRPDAKELIRRDRNLSYGFVVTFPPEGGKVTVDVKDVPDAAEKWVAEVINGAFKSVKDVADAAAKTVGKDKVEEAA